MKDKTLVNNRRIAIFNAAIKLFEGDEDKATTWLNKSVKGLGNKRPIDMAITQMETKLVLDLISRLEDGIVS